MEGSLVIKAKAFITSVTLIILEISTVIGEIFRPEDEMSHVSNNFWTSKA